MDASMDRRSVILSLIGIVTSLAGIYAYFLPWHDVSTGLDLATGTLGDLPSAVQVYMPTIATILMAFILVFSIVNLSHRHKKIPAFTVIILGFIVLGITMAFSSWAPLGTKMMFDGGMGMYLMVASSCAYIFAGIAVYMIRGVPQN